MLLQEQWSPDQLADLFQTVRQGKPAYAQICSFFKELFILQKIASPACRPPAMAYDPAIGAAQRRAELPLIQRDRMSIDWPAAHTLFHQLCNLAPSANEDLAAAAQAMMGKLQPNGSDLETCGALMLADDPKGFEQKAAALDIKADVLAFFIYHSIRPSAACHLQALKQHLPADEDWQKGYCPFCGSTPMLSLLGKEGHRYLVCSFCRHEWAAPRLFCPSCENRDPETLGYFFSEAEKEYRVNTCQACKGYIKSIDLRQLARPLYLPLEAILTTHLDIKAREQGYENMTPGWLRM